MVSQEAENKVDAALELAGSGTLWMWRTFLATSICGVFNMWLLLSWVYLAPEVPFHCKISALDNAGFTEEQQLELTNSAGKRDCEVPNLDYNALGNLSYDEALKKAKEDREKVGTVPCEDYTFAQIGTSCVEEFRLVCDRAVLLPTLQTVVPAGKLLGSLFMGWFSDGLGRKIGFIISSSFYMAAAAIPFMSQDYTGLCVGRCFMGIGGTGCFYSGLTLSVEVASLKWRSILGVLFNLSYAVGMVTLPLMSMFITQWRHLLLAVTMPVYLLFASMWIIPESPRWLVTKGKYSKAWKILKKADKRVEEILGEPPPDEEKVSEKITFEDVKRQILRILKLISNFCVHPELIFRLLDMVAVWFFVNLNYYVFPLSADTFGVDSHVFNVVNGFMEAIGYTAPILLLKWFPRRLLGFGLLVIAGAALIITIPIPRDIYWIDILVLIVIMIIRVTNSAVFAVIIVLTAELFPTEERATALGICSATAHVAGMISSFLVTYEEGPLGKSFAILVCGAATLVIAVLILLVPETKGKPLIDTIEELEQKVTEGDRISFRNLVRFKWDN